MNKVVCLQIIKPINITWEIFGNIIYELQNETRYVKNKTLALYNDWTNYVIEEKNKTGEYPKLIDKHGYKIFSGWAYDEFKNDTECECLNSANYTASIRNICVAYDTHKKDIICGKCSVPTANTNQPIDLHNKSIKARKESAKNCINKRCVCS